MLDLETVPEIDVTAAEMVVRLREELEAAGTRLSVARDIGQVRDVLRSAGDEQRVCPTIGAAVAAAQAADAR